MFIINVEDSRCILRNIELCVFIQPNLSIRKSINSTLNSLLHSAIFNPVHYTMFFHLVLPQKRELEKESRNV